MYRYMYAFLKLRFICVFGCIICFIDLALDWSWSREPFHLQFCTLTHRACLFSRLHQGHLQSSQNWLGSVPHTVHHFDPCSNGTKKAKKACPKLPGLKEQNKTSPCKFTMVLWCVMSLKPCLRLRSLCFYGCFSYHLQAGDAPLDVESGCLPIMHSSDILRTKITIFSIELVIEGQLQPTVRSETPTSFTTGGAQRPEHRHWHPRSLALQVVRVLRFDTSRRV